MHNAHNANNNDIPSTFGAGNGLGGVGGVGTTGLGHTDHTGAPLSHNNDVAHNGTTGTHTGIGAGTHNPTPTHALPSSTHPTHPSTQTKAAHSEERMGKIELAAGKILHSTTLKAKGEAKIEHAHAIQNQSSELNEAERLEAEAKLRRERADAFGQSAGLAPPPGVHGGFPQPAVAGTGGHGPSGLDGVGMSTRTNKI